MSEQLGKNFYRMPLVLRRGMSIAHGHLDCGVPQDFFDRYKVDPADDHIGGCGMAQIMKPKVTYSGLATRCFEGRL
jgi:hypothetical protein